ncbi:MAG: metallophosphoesterase [bacterium]
MHKNNPHSLKALLTFISVASVLLIEANIVVYNAVISLLAITSHATRVAGAILLTLLSGGFLGMLVVERFSKSRLTRFLYRLTAIWTGSFAYLLIAGILYDISAIFVSDTRPFGVAFFGIAILVSIYGYINGRRIVTKKISVTLPNLPLAWHGRTAVWMSDLHLGSVRGTAFSKKVTALSNSLSPDVVFIGGDLYDGTHAPDPYEIAQPLTDLTAPRGVYFISGNHEEFGDPTPFVQAVEKIGITILNDKLITLDGLQILGVDYQHATKKEAFKMLLEKLAFDKSLPSILLKHEPKDLEIAEQAGVSFQISGHTHRGQQWPFNYLANIAYKGFGYGLKPLGNLQVYVSSGIGGWGPPLRVGSNCEIVHITFL